MNQLKSLVVMMFALGLSTAQARSLHPCTPIVPAQPMKMYCAQGDLRYSIEIDTLMSPATPQCSGDQHFEYQTAKVEVSTISTNATVETFELLESEFTFRLGTPGLDNGQLSVPSKGLQLNGCVSPAHAGISFGN